jgi:hypothetical protein
MNFRVFIKLILSCAFVHGFFSFSVSKKRSVCINIQPVFANEKIELYKSFAFGDDTLAIKTFRFYISRIQFIFENGNVFNDPVSHHLADAEFSESLTLVMNNVPAGKIKLINYIIGVDSVANVSGALDGDLDPAKGMYWAWNSGYIHAKLEGTSAKSKAHKHEFEFHIGGYLKPYCASRKISLEINSLDNMIHLKADAHNWFRNVDLSKTNSIVTPCEAATMIADNYSTMFSVGE